MNNEMMKVSDNIDDLIRKFKEGIISFEEFSSLSSHFTTNEPKGEILDYFDQLWNEAEEHKNIDADPTKINRITRRIKASEPVELKREYNLLLRLTKYAAVLLIGFGISFFFSNKKKATPIISENTYQQISVPFGSKSSIILPDGSTVILNSGSKIKYPNNFGSQTRVVTLEGEGYFEVKKDTKKPFIVNASGIKIKVLGTTFNIKAYPDEKNIETSLITGSIEIYKDDNSSGKNPLIVLKPNQKAILEKTSQLVSVDKGKADENKIFEPIKHALKESIAVKSGNETKTTIAWKDNKLIFNNELFSEITRRIERWYDVEITVIDYPELENTRLSGKFDKETVEQAIEALRYATPFKFKIEKNIITIKKI
jgi:ferric-dicitrate binding protein FerR (iron transport regulator)